MQLTITLNSDEVKTAIADYLKDVGIDTEDKAISVVFDSVNECTVTLSNVTKRRKRRTPSEMAIARKEANAAIDALDKEENTNNDDGKEEDVVPEEESLEEEAPKQVEEPADTQSLFKQ